MSMFERLRLAVTSPSKPTFDLEAVSNWSDEKGYTLSVSNKGFCIEGKIFGKKWALNCGASARPYINGWELHIKAEIDIDRGVSFICVSRTLKEKLESSAYRIDANSVETIVQPNDLPQEIRWLATHKETGWDGMPYVFWGKYSIYAANVRQPRLWLTQPLALNLISWPEGKGKQDAAFLLTVMRGVIEIRMQHDPADLPRMEHAMTIFNQAYKAALEQFGSDLML
jgi:hypothetical protein